MCRDFWELFEPKYQDYVDRFSNHLWILVTMYPDKDWGWRLDISKNSNITWEIVQTSPDKPWSWTYLSINPNITWSIVRDNPGMPWDWKDSSRNPFNKK